MSRALQHEYGARKEFPQAYCYSTLGLNVFRRLPLLAGPQASPSLVRETPHPQDLTLGFFKTRCTQSSPAHSLRVAGQTCKQLWVPVLRRSLT